MLVKSFTVICDQCRKEKQIDADTPKKAIEALEYAKFYAYDGQHLCEDCARELGVIRECTGEAHSNPHIDHCGVCMPRWGIVMAKPGAITLRRPYLARRS